MDGIGEGVGEGFGGFVLGGLVRGGWLGVFVGGRCLSLHRQTGTDLTIVEIIHATLQTTGGNTNTEHKPSHTDQERTQNHSFRVGFHNFRTGFSNP